MPTFAFCGAAYADESLAIEAQESINLMPHVDSAAGARSKLTLVGTPGLANHCTLPKLPIRGVFGGDGTYYAVAADTLYQVFANGTYNARSGTLANDGLPVTMAPNGNQLLIVSGGYVYCDSGSGPIQQYFSEILADMTVGPAANQITPSSTALPFDSTDVGNTITITSASGPGWILGTYTITAVSSGNATLSATVGTVGSTMGAGFETLTNDGPISASCCAFLNGYFLVAGNNVTSAQPMGPKQFNISHSYEGRIWEILDNGVKQLYPDNIQFLLSDHAEMWTFGDNVTTEIFRDTGGAGNGGLFPFETDPSALMHEALLARFSAVSIAGSVAWLGGDPRGGPIAWLAHGYQPQQISTPALEAEWKTYTTVSDAVAYAYAARGHQLYVVSFPTANKTWAYDLVTGMWHRWGWWNGSSWDRHRVAFHAWEFGKHLGADWQNGNIYWMDSSFYQDVANPIYARRTAPYISDEWQRIAHNKLRLDMDFTSPSNLTITVAWSDDQGKNWTAERAYDSVFFDHGDGTHALGVEWRRLGTARQRLYRVTISGNARRAIANAYINPTD